MTVSLRPTGPDDEPFLREVYSSSREDELAAVPWTPEQRAAFLDLQFRAQALDYARRFPHGEHSIVLLDGEPVGRVWVNLDEVEVRLLDITLLTAARGRGAGSAVLWGLQERAREAGLPLRHTVLVTNVDAQRLYRRLGFVEIDATDTHLLMEWHP